MQNSEPLKSNEKIDQLFLRNKILELTSIDDIASQYDTVNVDSYLTWYSKKKYNSYLEYIKDKKSVHWFFNFQKMLDQLKSQLQKKQEENQNKTIEVENKIINDEPIIRTNRINSKPIYSSDGSHKPTNENKTEHKDLIFADFCKWISINNKEITKMYSTNVENKIHNFLNWILKKVDTEEKRSLDSWKKSLHTFIQKDLYRR